jgi:hypothetical protein
VDLVGYDQHWPDPKLSNGPAPRWALVPDDQNIMVRVGKIVDITCQFIDNVGHALAPVVARAT